MFLEAANLTSSVDSWAVGVVGLAMFSGPNMNSKLLTIIMVLVLYLRFPFPCNDDEKVDGCLSAKAMVMMTMFLV